MNLADLIQQAQNLIVVLMLLLAVFCFTLLIELVFFTRVDRHWYLRTGFWYDSLRTMLSTLPMMGLLGTIVGLLNAFYAMSLGREYDHQDLVSQGIIDAMFTTELGLLMVVPGWLLLGRLDHRRQQWTAHPPDDGV